jgi:predicted dinucleotide-utilizing enzyme
MKLPSAIRQLTRTAIGLRKSEAITPVELQALAAREDVLVLSVGMLSNGGKDDRLPGEQREASLSNLAHAVAGVPKTRAIVTHCG